VEPRAVKMVQSYIERDPDSMEVLESVLGGAAANCAMKDSCIKAQGALLSLMQSKICTDECAWTALTRMAFVKSRKDMHPSLLAYYQKHSNDVESEHWEPSSMMLGTIAKHVKEPELVQHLHATLDEGADETGEGGSLPKATTFRQLHAAIHAIGNAGYPAAADTVERYTEHTSELVQRTATMAMRNFEPKVALPALLRIGRSARRNKGTRMIACDHLMKEGHPGATACHESIKMDEIREKMAGEEWVNPHLTNFLADASQGVGDAMTDVLKNLQLPFSLNISHFIDKRWAVTLGKGRIKAKLSAGFAAQYTAKIANNTLNCFTKAMIPQIPNLPSFGKTGDEMLQSDAKTDASALPALPPGFSMGSLNECLMTKAEISAMLDATGDFTVEAFKVKLNIVRAQFVAAATLLPLPMPQGNETWFYAMEDNYRVSMDMSLLGNTIPIFKSGRLVKDFRVGNKVHHIGGSGNSDGDGDGDGDGEGVQLIQEDAEGIGSLNNGMPTLSEKDKDVQIPPACQDSIDPAGPSLKTVWSKDFLLGKIVIPVYYVLKVEISFNAGIGIRVGYNFQPCGSMFDLSVYGSATAKPFAHAHATGAVKVDLVFMKVGIELHVPLLSVQIVGTAAAGGSIQNIGAIKGAVKLRLAMDPWAFTIKPYIEIGFRRWTTRIEFILLKFSIKGFDTLLLYLTIEPMKLLGLAVEPAALLESFKTSSQHKWVPLITDVQTKAKFSLPRKTPYKLGRFGLSKRVDRQPVSALGQANYKYCKTSDQCLSGVCAPTQSMIKTVCRPLSGFAKGKPCYFTRDCDINRNHFCKHKRTPAGVCSAQTKDYGTCLSNAECLSGTCAMMFGVKCRDKVGNCACRPEDGFKAGTRATNAWDCESHHTEKAKDGLPICTSPSGDSEDGD